MSSGDGWVWCASGHRHWGRYGAAGLLLIDEDRVILQHRAAWTHEGDSWGVPGGARNSDEDALAAAVREAGEEAALQPADVDPIGLYVDDHDGWTYTTVVGRPTRSIHPVAANAESVSVRWHRIAEVADLRLHAGFAAAWQQLRNVPRPLFLIAASRLAEHPLLRTLTRTGIALHRLPPDTDGGGLSRLFPHPVLVDGPDDLAAAVAHCRRVGQLVQAEDAEQLSRLGAFQDSR
jgi:8-oxo-dGTP diphosphatase